MSILVVRHGETDQNAARVFQVPETPLSANGRAQAGRLAERIAGRPITRILASDYARALETASYASALTGAPVEIDASLRERNFGDLRGTPHAALARDPYGADYVPPNGESWAQFRVRIAGAWEIVARAALETRGDLLVVTHGLVCQVLADSHWQLAPGTALPARWENSALSEVDATPPWTARLLNCAAHLAPGAAAGASTPA